MCFNCWGSMARQPPSPTPRQSCFPDTIRTQCISQVCETPYLGRRFDSVFQLGQPFLHLLLPTVVLCWRSTSNALRLQATEQRTLASRPPASPRWLCDEKRSAFFQLRCKLSYVCGVAVLQSLVVRGRTKTACKRRRTLTLLTCDYQC